jgi:cytochrome c-type biogenesis protein CcmE
MSNKYIFGGVIIVVFLGIMAYLFTQTNIKYEDDFSNVVKSSRTVKAAGSWVKEKGYDYNQDERTFSFYLKDNKGTELKVVYNGSIPNNFEVSKSVVVTGKFTGRYLEASDILTKCPSKYQDEMTQKKST